MPIKNYTTKIPAAQTVGEIQALLAKHGVRAIFLEYDGNANVVGVSFRASTPHGVCSFRLPAHVDNTLAVLERQSVKCDWEMAERVAWRNVKDWIDAQMALIEMETVTVDEVFFPYMLDGSGKTLYEAFSTNGLLESGAKVVDE